MKAGVKAMAVAGKGEACWLCGAALLMSGCGGFACARFHHWIWSGSPQAGCLGETAYVMTVAAHPGQVKLAAHRRGREAQWPAKKVECVQDHPMMM